MNTATCSNRREQRLVDARFVRPLKADEIHRLESHLAVCPACVERYRRAQLAERVVCRVEDAITDPSQAEIDRIACDLGLDGDTPKTTRPVYEPLRQVAGALALAVVVVVVVIGIRGEDAVIERGGGSAVPMSFSAYVLGKNGSMRAHTPSIPVQHGDHLKLRASWPPGKELPVRSLLLAFVCTTGVVGTLRVEVPKTDRSMANLPGALPLTHLPDGRAFLYVLGVAGNTDEKALVARLRSQPETRELADELGGDAIVAERIELMVGIPDPSRVNP